MTSFKQIDANRRNARLSTGPITERGKQRSRQNAVRHGLTAETVIGALENADDYSAFEQAVIADYDAQSAVERELVLRLASLLWRIRRATTMETGLFEIQAGHVLEFQASRAAGHGSDRLIRQVFGLTEPNPTHAPSTPECMTPERDGPISKQNAEHSSADFAYCFLRLANLASFPLDRISRYEASLWRQAGQTLFALEVLQRRKPWERRSRLRPDLRG